MTHQTEFDCPTPETHNWGCGCPTDVAAAIASCPGHEVDGPSPCRCPCEGCKHNCAAHRPAAVSAAVAPPTDATHGLSVQHADALWDAVAIPGPRTPTYPEQHERVCRAVRDILDELTPARDEEADQTALRDRIAEAIENAYQDYSAEGHALPASDMADAVLAVLPTTDRTAVLRVADELRRMADETATETTEDPARIDRLRPEFTEHASVEAIDAQLDRARRQERRWHIRAEWLIGLRQARTEQPAAGARQDGAET